MYGIILTQNDIVIEKIRTIDRVDRYAEGCRLLREYEFSYEDSISFTHWENIADPRKLMLTKGDFKFFASMPSVV